MEKFGFDYLLKRQELLTEMPRPNDWVREIAAADEDRKPKWLKWNNFYEKTLNTMHSVGKVPVPNTREKTLVYLISLLGGDDVGTGNGGVSDMVDRLTIPNKRLNPKYEKWLGTRKDTKQMRKAYVLNMLVKDNLDYATSDEFMESTLDPDNIVSYVESPLGIVPQNSNYGLGMTRRKEDLHKMDIKQIGRVKTDGYALAKQIHKLMRKMRGKNYKLEPEEGEDDSDLTPDYYYAASIEEELAQIGAYVSNYSGSNETKDTSIWGNTNKSVVDPQNSVQWRLYFGKNLSLEDFMVVSNYIKKTNASKNGLNTELMTKFTNVIGQHSPILSKLGNYLMTVAEQSVEVLDTDESNDYPGYDNRALTKVLTDEEKQDLFDDWYQLRQREQAAINKRYVDEAEREQAKLDRESMAMGDKPAAAKSIDDEIAALYQKGYASNNLAEIQRIKKKIARLQAQLEQGEEDEETVMGYMTEQISKDSHFNPRGEFVERGFKRPVNYNHWMHINS